MREIMLKTGLVLGSIALLLLAACGGESTPTTGADADAVTLVAMGQEALGLARKIVPDAVLRQVDVSPDGGAISFRYTDEAATQTVRRARPRPRGAKGRLERARRGTYAPYRTGQPRHRPSSASRRPRCRGAVCDWPLVGMRCASDDAVR